MRQVKQLIRQVAPAQLPIVIEGETGTGKELVAQALHELSGRTGAFVPVNVSAYPDALLDGALFGHARGAFTGAHRDAHGLLEEARNGTLFLDEIGTLSPASQAKLLRAIETRTWRRLGEAVERKGSFRVVAATNEPLTELVRAGRFRADLAFRLRGLLVSLPPLRTRGADIVRLAAHFAGEQSISNGAVQGTSRDVIQVLRSYAWPGNVRELRSVMEASVQLSDAGGVSSDTLLRFLPGGARSLAPLVERAAVVDALTRTGGDPLRAAELLGVSRATIYRKVRLHGARMASLRAESVPARPLSDNATG